MAGNRSKILLEPDRTLLDQHLLVTKEDDVIDELLLRPAREEDSKPWKIIKPSPGFCVKLRKADGEKVFINVCKTDELPAPDEITDSELMKILSSDEPSSYRVPMSIGEERSDTDKSGNPCAVFDIVVNTTFYRKVESNPLFRQFLLTCVLEALEDKYDLILEKEEFIVLKNLKSKGGMTEHRVQVRNKPLVQVLPSGLDVKAMVKSTQQGAESEKKPLITEIKTTHLNASKLTKPIYPKEPSYVLSLVNSEESGQQIIEAAFFLRDISMAKEIELDVGEDRILLQTDKNKYFLDIFLPHLIDQERVTANFSVADKVLSVKIPVAG
ncbi:hypothetical protein J437_LFUL010211 [Ladona fulva]|uniref:PIH1 domain-containing protein 1 n=1 Tax=Ladona fulva TaxID=123851 RepID=A0A8K0K8M8_LADFU|nr:hypothetical protein J437_LFUL010211 [Ladona fulva]